MSRRCVAVDDQPRPGFVRDSCGGSEAKDGRQRLDSGDVAGAREYAEQARRDLTTEMTSLRTLMTELRSPMLDEGSR